MPPAELDHAVELFEGRRFAGALQACRDVLAADPGNVAAEHLLARVLTETGHAPMAAMMLQRVAALRPQDAGVQVSLGRALELAGEPDPARAALEAALALDAESLGARVALARVHLRTGDVEAALDQLRTALDQHPAGGAVHFWLANALVQAGRLPEARTAFAQAVHVEPACVRAHVDLATSHEHVGDLAAARDALATGALLQPEDPELRHLLAAAAGEPAGTRASDEYLVGYFDRFAAVFDEQLRELEYRTPELLAGHIAPLVDGRSGALDVLDAGCGTGLSGPLLRPLARRLVGVDISPGMLERARGLELYDDLVERELVAYLREVRGSFDVVVAADVLTYFGEIAEVIGLMVDALRPGGVLAVSVELSTDQGQQLRTSGRWAHSRDALLAAALAAGVPLDVHEVDLRFEHGRPLAGLLGVGQLT
jgi:predicted TPR repeat methyltransferase